MSLPVFIRLTISVEIMNRCKPSHEQWTQAVHQIAPWYSLATVARDHITEGGGACWGHITLVWQDDVLMDYERSGALEGLDSDLAAIKLTIRPDQYHLAHYFLRRQEAMGGGMTENIIYGLTDELEKLVKADCALTPISLEVRSTILQALDAIPAQFVLTDVDIPF